MKRTTYILIGVFLTNIVIGIAVVFYMKSQMVPRDSFIYKPTLSKELSSMDVKDVHTLKFVVVGMGQKDAYFTDLSKVRIIPSSNGDEKINFPKADCLKLNKQDGVLSVVLDLESTEPVKGRVREISLEDLSLEVEIGNQLKVVESNLGFEVTFRDLSLDTLYLSTFQSSIESCTIGSLFTQVVRQNLVASHSSIEDLYIDLDNVREWPLDKSHIKTLHLTGSGKRKSQLSTGVYEKVLWEPKDEGSELIITLKEKAEISFTK